MAKKRFKLKDIFSMLGSKTNKEGTSFKAPSSSGNIKKEMDWKYGHGEFADIKKRRKPGESKFQYNVRMRKEASRGAKSEYTTQEKKLHEQMFPAEQDDPMWNEPGYIQGKHGNLAPNPNDKRPPKTFGAAGEYDNMSFAQAFQQAELDGIEVGKNFHYKGDKYKFEYKAEAEEVPTAEKTSEDIKMTVDPITKEKIFDVSPLPFLPTTPTIENLKRLELEKKSTKPKKKNI